MQSGHLQKEPDQPKATRPDCDKHPLEGQRQAVEEGEARNALKELDPRRTGIKPLLPRVPGWQGGAGPLKPVGALTLCEALSWQGGRRLAECSASDTLPALVTVNRASW
jgi:hypothetical protein